MNARFRCHLFSLLAAGLSRLAVGVLIGIPLLLSLAMVNCSLAAESSTPNIVLIFIDDLGQSEIGPFGNTKVSTPHLDRMASEGMKFSSFYATPVCSMSRACLMTGCYNTRVSVPGVLFPNAAIGLHTNEITLAEIAKQQGYATKCIGKWHLGHREPFLPTQQGFDSYYGIPYSNDMTIDTKHAKFAANCVFREDMNEERARLRAIRNTVPLMRDTEVIEYPADQATLTKRYTAEAVQFIRDHQAKPFFLYLPHTMVHDPLAASAEFKGKSKMGLLGDAIEELDWSVGQIFSTLSELKLDERTLVIFTSDNGAAGRPSPVYRGSKATIFEGGVREPCIMRWPGKIPANTTCQQIAGNIDLLPTFAKLLNVPVPADRVIDGRDITPLMFNPNAPAVRDTHLYFTGAGRLGAIRQGNWKLFIGLGEAEKLIQGNPITGGKPKADQFLKHVLYDLSADLAETKDVAEEHPEVVAKLAAEAKARLEEIEKNRRPVGSLREE
jgi:arylsulfatase A-like enzyme